MNKLIPMNRKLIEQEAELRFPLGEEEGNHITILKRCVWIDCAIQYSSKPIPGDFLPVLKENYKAAKINKEYLYRKILTAEYEDLIAIYEANYTTLSQEEDIINTLLNELQYFVDRVENGTIRSKVTYSRYKAILEKFKNSNEQKQKN